MTLRFLSSFVVLTIHLAGQQPRDPGAMVPAGTSSISGQVVTDEPVTRAVRRAIVTVSAKKAAFLSANYGASRPGRPGTPLSLGSGQQASVTIRMVRGAVIAGLVTDQNGRPVPGAQITADKARTPTDTNPPAGTAITDDRGRYRIYGLLPGEYVVGAKAAVTGSGAIGARSTAELDALLGELTRRQAVTRPSVSAVPPSVAFPMSYFPATPLITEAQPVKVAAGEERDTVDIHVLPIRAANVEGTIGGIENLDAIQFSIVREGQRGVSSTDFNPALTVRPSGADNRFKYTNVTPGHYTIMTRANRNQTGPAPSAGRSSAGGGGGLAPPASSSANDFVYAVAEVDVRGDDVAGLSLVLQSGSILSGRMVFDGESAPPIDLTKARINIATAAGGSFMMQSGNTIIGTAFSSVPAASVTPDGAFTISNIPPGVFLLRGALPADAPVGWWLRSAKSENRDLLDGPVEFRPGVNLSGVVLTFSDKHTEVSGTLRTSAGRPASEFFVLVFSSDPALWGKSSRRVANARPASDGAFAIRDLPAGDYLIAALDDLDPADLTDPRFLERVVPAALKIALADGEKKKQDLTIAR
jgi:uncharacterized protein (DUF2141 family)